MFHRRNYQHLGQISTIEFEMQEITDTFRLWCIFEFEYIHLKNNDACTCHLKDVYWDVDNDA